MTTTAIKRKKKVTLQGTVRKVNLALAIAKKRSKKPPVPRATAFASPKRIASQMK
jgi:hypothetical protein